MFDHAFPLICIHITLKLEEIWDKRTVTNMLTLKKNKQKTPQNLKTKAVSLET